MRVRRFLITAAAALLLTGASAPAASPRDALVVSSSWLAQHLSDANLVLLQIGGDADKADYALHHIPGARFVAFSTDLAVMDRSAGANLLEMLTADALHDRLQALGISDNSRVVAYYGKNQVTPATRVMLTLDYAGLDHVSLLDGGMGAWTREGHQITDAVTPERPGKLAKLKPRAIVVDADFVRAHLNAPHFSIVDGRTTAFYEGAQTGGSKEQPHKTGHIAGAHNVPYSEITDDAVMLKSPEALAALFEKAGVPPGDTVIGYCHIGQQATAMLFAARTLGHPVLLYDGSFEDWSRRDYPVDGPIKKHDR